MKQDICKNDFLDTMHRSIRLRISEASDILDGIQESIDSESHSTAGDKHDTSRELMQQERNKAAQNLQNQISMDHLALRLKTIQSINKVGFGSLVLTSIGWFFVGLPLGKISFNECDVLCISGNAPVAKLLSEAVVGDLIQMNEQSIHIISVK